MKTTRRQFIQVGALSSLSLLSSQGQARRRVDSSDYSLISYKAHHFSEQKNIKPVQIEGIIPQEIKGELFRVAPGNKLKFGEELDHFFDGDAYLTKIKIAESQVEIQSSFLETEKFLREQSSQKRIYSDFGTSVPGLYRPKKDAPSINVIPYDDKLLALSDTSLPSLIDPQTFEVEDLYDFSGALPNDMTFSAHPKYDFATKKYFAMGLKKSLAKTLVLFTLDDQNNDVQILNEISLDIFPLIHDFMLTKNYIVLIVPPIEFSIWNMVFNQKSYGDSIREATDFTTQMIVCDKQTGAFVSEFKMPHFFSFHHVNAYEENSKICFDSIVTEDSRIFDYLNVWNKKSRPKSTTQTMLRHFEVDLESSEVEYDNYDGLTNIEFPSMKLDAIGTKMNYCYLIQSSRPDEPLAFNKLVKTDLRSSKSKLFEFEEHQVCGEALFVPRGPSVIEDDGYLLSLGYDRHRDESFLQIVEAQRMVHQARIWLGRRVPLGFHGCFINRN